MIGEIIRNFPQSVLDIYSRGAPEIVRGRATPGPVTIIQGRAVVVPPGSRELMRLPEGQRTKEAIRIFGNGPDIAALRVLDGEQPADELRYRGLFWEVSHVALWDHQGDFRDVMAVLKHRSHEVAAVYLGFASVVPADEAAVRALAMQYAANVRDATATRTWPAGQRLIYAAPSALAQPVEIRDIGAVPEDDVQLGFTAAPSPVSVGGVPYTVLSSVLIGDGATHTFAVREVAP